MNKYALKVKSTLDLQPDEKLLVGKLSNSASKPTLGYVNVYFEVNSNGVVAPANPRELMISEYTQKPQVFIRGGYEGFEKEYGYEKLFLFKATVNQQSADKGDCYYTCVFILDGQLQHMKIPKDNPFVAEISQTEFDSTSIHNIQSEYTIDQADNDYQDTPYFFQIDRQAKKILGPIIQNNNKPNVFHGPHHEITLDFWNSRTISNYETLLSSYDKYEDHIVTIKMNGVTRTFLINLDSFYIGKNNKPRNQDFNVIDLIPESCLLNEFYNAAKKSISLKLFPKGKVKEWLDNKSIRFGSTRKARLFSILTKFENDQENISKIYKSILDSEQAEPILKKIAESDDGQYLERYRNKENAKLDILKEEIQQQRDDITQQNDAVKKELSRKQQELAILNKNKQELQHKIQNKLQTALENIEQSEEYQTMLNEKNKVFSEINQKTELAIQTYGHYTEIDKIASRKTELEKDIEYLERKKEELALKSKREIKEFEETIKGLKEQAREDSSTLARTYLNQQIISDIQNHDHYKYFQNKPIQTVEKSENYAKLAESQEEFATDDNNANRKAVIKIVLKRLEQMNRTIKYDKVEAALIAIMQNQYSVLIGVPGSGKTSFAIQLGCALGAAQSTLIVPVAKDWTRPKDLMGYYNPITSTYEPGVTDFFPFYQSLNQQPENVTTNSFLILDEFNLSQPEFYMSNLTGLADNSSNRVINLGHNTNITIPTTSRFVCTANTDETVQSLSARMISRCAFIQFNDLPELDQAATDLIFPQDLEPLLTGTDMVELFSANESDVLSGSLKTEIDKLVSTFREYNSKNGNGISITPRKYNQLLQFCKVMSIQEHGQSNVLDYAANFFLLPLISGTGQLFKSRLLDIKSLAEDLSLDEFVKNLECIINDGEANFENYRFIMG